MTPVFFNGLIKLFFERTTFFSGVEGWWWSLPETLVVSGLAAVAAVPAGTRAVVAARWGALHAVPPLSVLQEAHHRVAWHLQDHTDPTSQTYNHQLASARPQRPPHLQLSACICKTTETPHIYNHQLAAARPPIHQW